MDKLAQYMAAERDHEIAMTVARGEGVPQDLKLAKELFVKQWRDWRNSERCRYRAVWGLIYIGYLSCCAVREGLEEQLIEEVKEQEVYWLGDVGCTNDSKCDLKLSGLLSENWRSDQELETYLEERRKTFKRGGAVNAKSCEENETLLFGEFVNRVDELKFRLIESWCLCKYCRMFDQTNANLDHWVEEFDKCVKCIRSCKIKGNFDKRRIISKMFIDDYDYNQERQVVFVIQDRFHSENIMDTMKRNAVAASFANSIVSLIDDLAKDFEDYADVVCEEANILRTDHPELPSNVFISARQGSCGPRIKVQLNYDEAVESDNMAPISISECPEFKGKELGKLHEGDLRYFYKWVVKNLNVLNSYWNGTMQIERVLKSLKY